MLIVTCQSCERSIDVTDVVPELGSNATVTLCSCGEAFAYRGDEIETITLDENVARKAA